MTGSEISIVYRTKLGMRALRLIKLSAVIWCVIPLVWLSCLAIRAVDILSEGGAYGCAAAMSAILDHVDVQTVALRCLVFITLGATFMILFSEDRIVLDERGIHLPFPLCFQFLSPRLRTWDELEKINRMNDETAGRLLRLTFFNGPSLVLEERIIAKTDRRRLLVGLETFMSMMSGDLTGDHDVKQLPFPRSCIKSFTGLWEQEMNLSFRPTTFVPLTRDDILEGERIRVIRAVSYGGSSAVYLARTDCGDTVALKELVVPAYASEEVKVKSLQLFKREAELLSLLNHPNIARIHDHFVESDRHYLLIDYIDGDDLRRLVRRDGTPSESQLLKWAGQIASILDYLHRQDPPVIHRDLTPENFVVDRRDRLCLIDFGAANQFIGTATGTIIGKQAYIPPEQFKGKATTQSDLYAFGCTLHFLMTGEDPKPLEVSSPRKIRSAVPEPFNDLVVSLTSQNPDKRPNAEEAERILLKIQAYSQPLSSH